jgi:RNA polymerase sigma-70 factor (ECF subfamily)
VDEPAPQAEMLRSEGVDAVRAELDRLEPAEREVVRLRHLEGWSFEQIARLRGLPASTVKDRCYRALMKLKGRLRSRDVSA